MRTANISNLFSQTLIYNQILLTKKIIQKEVGQPYNLMGLDKRQKDGKDNEPRHHISRVSTF